MGGKCGRIATRADQVGFISQAARRCRGPQQLGPGIPCYWCCLLLSSLDSHYVVVSGFQSSFSTELETLTMVASKPMLALLWHHQGWRDRVQVSSGWTSPRNDWPKLDPLSVLDRARPSLHCSGCCRAGAVLILITTQEKHSTSSGRKDSTSIGVMLSLFLWLQKEYGNKLKHFRVFNISVAYTFLQWTSCSVTQ